MKKSNKMLPSTVIAFAIALVAYILLVTVIPFRKGVASWISFAFGCASICIACGITLLAFNKGEGYKSKIYGLPVIKVGAYYLIAQMAVSIIIYAVTAFVNTPAWIALLSGIILLALCALGVLLTDNLRAVAEELDRSTEISIKTMKAFTVSLDAVVNACTDDTLRPSLESLAEDFKYSDPVSSEATEEIEATIKAEIDELLALVVSNDESARDKVAQIKNNLSTRNAICKSSK